MNEIYEDGYSKTFAKESDFLDFLREREANANWRVCKSNELRFEAMDGDFMQEYDEKRINILADTYKNTRLLLKVSGESYPVRNCAVKTIFERARISGNALNKVGKPVLARILNDCLTVAPGDALLRQSDEKISAVHGGDAGEYSPLEMPDLFGKTVDFLNSELPGSTFAGGFFGHEIVTAVWELTEQDALLETYKEALKKHGFTPKIIKPALRLTSSDVGVSGANLFPALVCEEHEIALGSALKLEHKSGANLEKFEEKLKMIFAQYTQAIADFTKLLEIEISNPANCMLGVMKRVGLPKKLAFEALEMFKAQNGASVCTAHEIYYAVCEIIFTLQCEGADGEKISRIEENIARILTLRWSDYDMLGDVKW